MSDEQLQRPLDNDDRDAWRAYWTAQGMPWRTEPEVDEKRQRFLTERRAITPDITHGVYPFKDIKLTRADVEWLLATHESGGMRGPVDWDDPSQRKREGLDLRGADLREVDLSGLPLARMRGGLSGNDFDRATRLQIQTAAVHMERASLRYARLEGSALTRAHLEGASLHSAHLEGADLYGMHLEAEPPADLKLAFFDAATKLDRIVLSNSKGVAPRLEGVRWNGADLSFIDWSSIQMLDDENVARQGELKEIQSGARFIRLHVYQRAVQAYRQLGMALQGQGLNEDADRFAYRAQLLQQQVLLRQVRLGRAFGSWLLDLVSGYGYKPIRSVITYLLVVVGFAAAYFSVTNFGITPFLPTHSTSLAWYEALVLSISSFHGRGLFPSALTLGDPIAILAAVEAVIGLLIEITFIATFTNRFFAR